MYDFVVKEIEEFDSCITGEVVPAILTGSPDNWTPDESWVEVEWNDNKDFTIFVPWSEVGEDDEVELEFHMERSESMEVMMTLYFDICEISEDGFVLTFQQCEVDEFNSNHNYDDRY